MKPREARALGLTRYMPDKPCKYGHTSERSTASGCLECVRMYHNSDKMKNYRKEHYAKPEVKAKRVEVQSKIYQARRKPNAKRRVDIAEEARQRREAKQHQVELKMWAQQMEWAQNKINRREKRSAEIMKRLRMKKEAAGHKYKLSQLLARAKMRAGKNNREVTITQKWLIERYTGRCEITGIPFVFSSTVSPYSISLDRINSKLGYTPENTRLVLWGVNALRGVSEDDVAMYHIAKAILDNTPTAVTPLW